MTKDLHLYASQRVSRRAKDGSDGTSVTIISKSVTYQISASGTEEPKGIWSDKVVLTTDTKPYLWTRTIVVYSDTNSITSYSVSYRGKDGTNGTSFTPKGTATGFFYNMSSVPSYEDGMDSDVYIVNVDDRINPTSELPPYVCHFEYENFIIEHAEFGDGYNVKGHLYVANSNEWVDFGEIQGAKGDPGDPGIDAINIVFSPAELVFDADENGNLKQAEKSAEIKVYRGITELQYKTDWDNDAEIGDNCRAELLVNTTTNKPEVKISGITSSNIDDVKVPATSGGANVSVIVDGVKYRAYLPFSVNVNTYANFLIRDNKKYISKYTEVSNKYTEVSKELDNKANKNDMEEKISTISQKADNIKLEVLSKTSGRRNMLVNSAFRNQDSVFIHSLARIEKNTGIDGVNCIHSSDKYSGTGDGKYIGAFWDSTQKNGVVSNIPIIVGKKYVISCWIKSDNKDLPFFIECLFMNSINQQNRGEDSIRKEYHVDNVNEWKRIDFVVDTTDTSEYASKVTPYLAVNFWSNTKNVPKATGATEYPTCHAYICQPMMEEGDTYGGWTLSEDDYEYVGGNILDNTRSLEKSGNLEKEESEIINEGYEYAYAVAHSNNTTSPNIEMLQWNVAGRINDGQDYMFSFLAKGTGKVSTYLWKDETPRFFVESSNNKHNDVSEDGDVYFELTKEWKRYWVHYHFNTSSEHPLPENLLLRCYRGNEVYICQPKLEIGATMTEFTERKTDLVDKSSLKKAGIEITSEQVTLYGNKVQVKTPKANPSEGYDEAAMFQNGKLNAQFINAGEVVAEGINAQKITATNLNVTGDSKIGIWHIKKVDGWGDIMQAEGTEYNGTTVVSGIQYCPLFVRGGSLLTDYFRVGVSCTEFSYTSGVNDFSAVWLGNAARIVCKGSSNAMNLPTNYTYNTQYEPVQYIYSEQSKKDSPALAINVIAKGFTGTPTAIQTNGAIRGVIAPNLRTMNYTQQISISDNIVVATASNITLTLPPHPVTGQTLIIFTKAKNVYIQCNGTEKMYANGIEQTKIEIGRVGNFTYFFFDGTNWCYSYFDGSHNSK